MYGLQWLYIAVAIHLLKAKQDSMSPGSLDPKQGSSTCKRRKESFTSQGIMFHSNLRLC